MTDANLFTRANATADIEAISGKPLGRSGKRLRGECPLCGASKGKKGSGAFDVNPERTRWKCWACGEGGDAVKLEHQLHSLTGETMSDAARRLLGESGEPRREFAPRAATPIEVRPDDDAWKAQLAVDLWRGAARAPGTPVSLYLAARGCTGRPLIEAMKHLRFHPAAYHSGPSHRPVRLPAMVGLVRAPSGVTGGVHVTYLAPDGRSKTHREPAKKMWGPQHRDGCAGGVWLTHPEADGPLIVAEGIESALSAAILQGQPCRVLAALSLGRLQGGMLTDRFGRIDPDMVNADPERPALTWPEPEAKPWGEVLLCVDRDMRPVTVSARKAAGGTWKREISPDERARICGGLAEQAWRRAGASAVRILAPGAGRDFNDELRARLADAPGSTGEAAA